MDAKEAEPLDVLGHCIADCISEYGYSFYDAADNPLECHKAFERCAGPVDHTRIAYVTDDKGARYTIVIADGIPPEEQMTEKKIADQEAKAYAASLGLTEAQLAEAIYIQTTEGGTLETIAKRFHSHAECDHEAHPVPDNGEHAVGDHRGNTD